MRIACLVEHPNHVCCRYRLAALAPLVSSQGIQLELIALPTGIVSRFRLFHQLKGRPVLLQRKLFSWAETTYLRNRASWLGFDFDDAVFLRDSYSPKGHHDSRRLKRFRHLMATADCVLAGNNFLAEQAKANGARGLVQIIPTSINPSLYFPKPAHQNSEKFELTWIGSSSTLQGLERMGKLFDRIATEVPGATMRVISDRFPTFQKMPVLQIPWSEKTEARELAEGDVGISWIPDDPWSRGKCGLKVLQYMASGLPVLANPVGVHPEMVTPGVEGYLPETDDQWVALATKLAKNPELRREMGLKARGKVESAFSVNRASELLILAIRQSTVH